MSHSRPDPMFIADASGLDFLNTVAAPKGSTIEWLGDGQDLVAWLEQAGLVEADVARGMRANTLPGELDAVAGQARVLREWFRGFVLAHAGRQIKATALSELGPLNRLLKRDEAFCEIAASKTGEEPEHSDGLHCRWSRNWRTPETLLLPVAKSMADLICDADFSMVKQCEGPGCTMLFLDTTKGHARRWCSMAMCGNRAKQASHRARAKNAN
jgi:predicted RNA-binding Zn ribbon-like protein